MSSGSLKKYPPASPMQYPSPSSTSTSHPSTILPLHPLNSPDQLPEITSCEPTESSSQDIETPAQRAQEEHQCYGIPSENPLLLPVTKSSSTVNTKQTDADETERQCRICFETSDNKKSESGRLISPCLCKGSSKYIHLGCLEKWRTASPKRESYFSCDTCHYHYSFSRPWIFKVLSNAWFVPILTVAIIVAIWIGFTYIGHALEGNKTWEWKKIVRSNPTPDTSSLDWMDYVFGVCFVGILGLITVVVEIFVYTFCPCKGKRRGSSDEESSSSYCGFSCLYLECGGADGNSFIIVLLLIGVFGAFIGLYIALSTIIEIIMDSMTESILEVNH